LAVNTEAIRSLQALGYSGIYITLAKEYPELAKHLQQQNIDLGKLAFIDGVSQMYCVSQVDAPNVTYVDGPLSIDAISQRVTEIGKQIPGDKKFVFLDSITTVLLYNSLERTVHFSQFLLNSFKEMQLVGVVVSVAEGFANQNLIKELTASSNEVINLNS